MRSADAAASTVGEADLAGAYEAWLAATGRGDAGYAKSVRGFFARWPDPQAWAAQPLDARLAAGSQVRPLLGFLMLHGHLRPGYDYLLERKLSALVREAAASPLAGDLQRFTVAAAELGYAPRPAAGMTSQIALRMLVQSGRRLDALDTGDVTGFQAALDEREARHGRTFKHYRGALFAARAVLYHLGAQVEPAAKRPAGLAWDWPRHLDGVAEAVKPSLVAYLGAAAGTRARSTVSHLGSRLAHFGRHLAAADPGLASLAGLDRQRHIEPWLHTVANACKCHSRAPLSISERRNRIFAVKRMLEDIAEWGWHEAPTRRLVFAGDIPRLPRPLPRYLPVDADRRLAAALEASPNRLRADALLLARATGVRIGELVDLERLGHPLRSWVMDRAPERFTTPRLVVRRARVSDAEALFHAYGKSEQATRYLTWPPKNSSAEFRKFLEGVDPAWDEGSAFHWIMQDREGGPAFGMISLEPGKHGVEVGYVLGPGRWGRGYMAEGAQPPIGWALAQPGVHRVWATCDCENTASVRVLEKLGFQREGTLRRWMVHPNVAPVPRDSFCYSVLP